MCCSILCVGELCRDNTLLSVFAEVAETCQVVRRRAAIEAGAVHALCNTLGSNRQRPLSLDVLKALYNLIAPDETGYSTTEMFAAGGVHALVPASPPHHQSFI